MTSKRIYGLDLLRILSMLGIIGLHIVNSGGLMNATTSAPQLAIVRFFASICYCSVNAFAMLTGFLYIGKNRIRSSNLINLLIIVAFYCISISLLFGMLMPSVFTNSRSLIIFSLFPPLKGRYWFITSYVLVFMMIPYLNAMIRALTQQQFQKMLLILFVLLSLVPTFGFMDYFKTMDGYSPAWLIFCYLIGAYIKLYYYDGKTHSVKTSIVVFLINVAIVTIFWFIAERTSLKSYIQLYKYTSPFMVINAACVVFAFSKIAILGEKFKKTLIRLSNCAFGVYIIHSHILVFDFLLTGAFSKTATTGIFRYCLTLLASLFGIYLFCWVIEEIRMLLFKVLHIEKMSNWIGEKIDHYLNWR